MKISLPRSHKHPLVKVTMRSQKWETSTTLDDSHSTVELNLPDGVNEDDVEVTAAFCHRNGEADGSLSPLLLKSRVERPKNVQYASGRSGASASPANVQAKPAGLPKADVSKAEVKQEVTTDATGPATGKQSAAAGDTVG